MFFRRFSRRTPTFSTNILLGHITRSGLEVLLLFAILIFTFPLLLLRRKNELQFKSVLRLI